MHDPRPVHEPIDPGYEQRVRDSFDGQAMMHTFGIGPGFEQRVRDSFDGQAMMHTFGIGPGPGGPTSSSTTTTASPSSTASPTRV